MLYRIFYDRYLKNVQKNNQEYELCTYYFKIKTSYRFTILLFIFRKQKYNFLYPERVNKIKLNR